MLDLHRFFFFNDTATTEIYTLSLHDALPISSCSPATTRPRWRATPARRPWASPDRKSTRLNSSHSSISYAVFCLKKKNDQARQALRNAASAIHTSSNTPSRHLLDPYNHFVRS